MEFIHANIRKENVHYSELPQIKTGQLLDLLILNSWTEGL